MLSAKTIKEHLDKGWLQAIVTFEVVGFPKKHVEEAIATYVKEVKTNKGIKVVDEEFGTAEEQDSGLFSIFYEGEFLISSLENLNWICINYTPASIEILEPGSFKLEPRELTNWYNDLLSKLHEIGLKMKELTGMNKLLTANMNKLIQNSILTAVDAGASNEDDIAAKVGINKEQLRPFLKKLIEAAKVKKSGTTYARTPKQPPRQKK
ncbi:hypothetical protein D6783_01840 [Candidatus Woesearchaeota archaeon]|nr:MAG: hypothetical protein D6783_01840 [Candidatus Woesearchaeota archaeon]